jgi:hypothetical protein
LKVWATVADTPFETVQGWVGKPVTDGEPGPMVGRIVAARLSSDGVEVTMEIDDQSFVERWNSIDKMSVHFRDKPGIRPLPR